MIHLVATALGLVIGVYGAYTAVPKFNLLPIIEAREIAGVVESNFPLQDAFIVTLSNGNRVRFTYADAYFWHITPGETITVRRLQAHEIQKGDRVFVRVNDSLEAQQVSIERL